MKSKKKQHSVKHDLEELFLLNMFKEYKKSQERLKEVEEIFYR